MAREEELRLQVESLQSSHSASSVARVGTRPSSESPSKSDCESEAARTVFVAVQQQVAVSRALEDTASLAGGVGVEVPQHNKTQHNTTKHNTTKHITT